MENNYSKEDNKVLKFLNSQLEKIDTEKKTFLRKEENEYILIRFYLTQNQRNKLYDGKPINSFSKLRIKLPKTKLLNFFSKDRKNLPYFIYIDEEQADEVFDLMENNNNKVKINLSKKKLSETLEETKKLNKKVDYLFDNFKDLYEKNIKKLDEEYDIFISNLMNFSSHTPMLENEKSKIFKIKNLLEKTKKVDIYYQTFVKINSNTIIDFLEKCIKGKTKGKFSFVASLKLEEINDFFKIDMPAFYPFVIYLSLKQKKEMKKAIKENKPLLYISLSNKQFHKTCFASVLINREIYHLKKYGTLAPPPKIKQITPPLAIEMKNLIDFDEPPSTSKPELIPTSKKSELISTSKKSELIPTSKKSELIPTSKKSELIPTSKKSEPLDKLNETIKKNLIDFTNDPYKKFTPYQSDKKLHNEIKNALINEIKNPLTKDIIGLNLSKEIKEKISKLTNEAAIGLTWIIRALVISNRGKLNVYYVNNKYYQLSKNQIKEIVEYYFNSLSLLLNPAQKK